MGKSDLRRAARTVSLSSKQSLPEFPTNRELLQIPESHSQIFSLFRLLIASNTHDKQTSRSAKSVFGSITTSPRATMQEVVKIDSRFAHTLLFSCPQCNLPVSVVRISDLKNGEEIDGERIRFKCGFCDYTARAYGVTAKMHYVYEWD